MRSIWAGVSVLVLIASFVVFVVGGDATELLGLLVVFTFASVVAET